MNNLQIHFRPAPPEFALWVDSLWMLENTGDQAKSIVVLPDGRIDLHFGNAPDEPFVAAIAGIDTQPSFAEISPGSRMCGLGFHPLAVEYLLKKQLGELRDKRVELEQGFWGVNEKDINSFDSFCHKIINQLQQFCPPDIDPRKQKMFNTLLKSQGSISVKELAEQSHWSERQINRYFNHWLGLSLKAYSSILRFRASFPQLKAGKLFPESDFADQSHFIKEIKKYSGHTPRELHKNQDDRFIQLSVLK